MRFGPADRRAAASRGPILPFRNLLSAHVLLPARRLKLSYAAYNVFQPR